MFSVLNAKCYVRARGIFVAFLRLSVWRPSFWHFHRLYRPSFTAKMTEAKRPLHGSSCVLEVALLSVKIREGTLVVFAKNAEIIHVELYPFFAKHFAKRNTG